MTPSLALLVPAFALGSLAAPDASSVSRRQQPTINATVEYTSQCKTCPWDLCTNVLVPWGGESIVATCWTEGDNNGDTDLWVKTTDECYLSEFDLTEQFDFRSELEWCGEVPLEITRQDATVRYLSECKWGRSTSSESMRFYGRDLDVELTCWDESDLDVVGNKFWYKTTDNCHVSGSGLWAVPDHGDLDPCGPGPGPRANETRRSLDDDAAPPTARNAEDQELEQRRDEESSSGLIKRYLQAELIGEEYAPCRGCPTDTVNSTCRTRKRYEYNDTVVSQCLTNEDIAYPNGTFESKRWLVSVVVFAEDRHGRLY
jgi:hypothetical protein